MKCLGYNASCCDLQPLYLIWEALAASFGSSNRWDFKGWCEGKKCFG